MVREITQPTFILKQTRPYIQCNWKKGLPQLVSARPSVQEALMGDLKVSFHIAVRSFKYAKNGALLGKNG